MVGAADCGAERAGRDDSGIARRGEPGESCILHRRRGERARGSILQGMSTGVSVDEFQALEQKVLRAVEIVKREREARAAAEAEVAALREQLAEQAKDAASQVQAAESQIAALSQEREAVRQRVEKMLQQMDELL